MHPYTRGDTPVKTNTLPFYLVSVLAHIYFKTMLQMILPPITSISFVRPLGVPIDCVTSFWDPSAKKAPRISRVSKQQNAAAINYTSLQLIVKYISKWQTLSLSPHIHAPQNLQFLWSCTVIRVDVVLTKQISDLNLSQTFKKVKQVFKAKGIVKAFQIPLLHS